ncbi:5436_t:CDS:2 [Scutellospora calospora]|uniref:5436_t:CDS:1 n=1 Tax=Scutellospora calospora TaxID=85575 RepID=A0ACA9N3X0_9GLOM|nr:5436_t:CDS:2 [Scutellospora calospora]
MGNMDKTPLSFDMPSNITIDDKGNKLLVLGLVNVLQLEFPSGVVIRANASRWMNEIEISFR